MKYDEICLEVAKEKAEEVEEWFWDRELSCEISDASTLDPPPLGQVRFRLYVSEAEREAIVAAMNQAWVAPKISVRSRDENEWRDVWKRFFHTRVLGRFVIVPSWEEAQYQPVPDQILIRLDPGRAFGTGGHASTRLCLELMESQTTQGNEVLDIGCGCGTLAIAALLANSKATAAAIDIDPEAVEVTKENAERNGVLSRIETSTTSIEILSGSYQLVLANLTGPTLVELADSIVRRLASNGYLILAGILQTEEKKVLQAFTSLGLECERSLTEEEWIAFRLRKLERVLE